MTDIVALVLKTQSTEELFALAEKMPVWIVSTPDNAAAVHALRPSLPAGQLTAILKRPGESDVDLLTRAAFDIDDHYGESSQPAPYGVLWVVGSNEPTIASHLMKELGFSSVEMNDEGFKVVR